MFRLDDRRPRTPLCPWLAPFEGEPSRTRTHRGPSTCPCQRRRDNTRGWAEFPMKTWRAHELKIATALAAKGSSQGHG